MMSFPSGYAGCRKLTERIVSAGGEFWSAIPGGSGERDLGREGMVDLGVDILDIRYVDMLPNHKEILYGLKCSLV